MAGESRPTRVTSSPSRIQVTPSAKTTSQWNRLQGSRSRRAGTLVLKVVVKLELFPGVSEPNALRPTLVPWP